MTALLLLMTIKVALPRMADTVSQQDSNVTSSCADFHADFIDAPSSVTDMMSWSSLPLCGPVKIIA